MEYTLKRSKRAKAMRLEVYPGGEVVVTAPHYFALKVIEHFFGKHIEWVRRKVEEAKGESVLRIPRRDIARLKKQALELARARVAHFAERYGVSYGRIVVRAQKTRWGSCSHKGDLSFNYRLAALPAHLADYVIVHEVCHILELNHSKLFWEHVARECPEYEALRQELRMLRIRFL